METDTKKVVTTDRSTGDKGLYLFDNQSVHIVLNQTKKHVRYIEKSMKVYKYRLLTYITLDLLLFGLFIWAVIKQRLNFFHSQSSTYDDITNVMVVVMVILLIIAVIVCLFLITRHYSNKIFLKNVKSKYQNLVYEKFHGKSTAFISDYLALYFVVDSETGKLELYEFDKLIFSCDMDRIYDMKYELDEAFVIDVRLKNSKFPQYTLVLPISEVRTSGDLIIKEAKVNFVHIKEQVTKYKVQKDLIK